MTRTTSTTGKTPNAHDILLCINTGEKQATPAIREFMDEGTVMKGGRFAFWNDQFYFKTQAENGGAFSRRPAGARQYP
jgi:DNA polymerase-3 subunit alpha